jgi:hypothetical protein
MVPCPNWRCWRWAIFVAVMYCGLAAVVFVMIAGTAGNLPFHP